MTLLLSSNADPTSQPELGDVALAGLTKAQAEAALDWLDAHGYGEHELRYTEGEGFSIRFRQRLVAGWAVLSRWRGKAIRSPTHTAQVA